MTVQHSRSLVEQRRPAKRASIAATAPPRSMPAMRNQRTDTIIESSRIEAQVIGVVFFEWIRTGLCQESRKLRAGIRTRS